MSGMRSRARPGRQESGLLAAPGRDIAVTAVVVVLTAGVFAAVGDHGALMSIKRWDDAWLRLMISGRASPLTAIARILNVLGLVYVTLPVRIAIAGLLAVQRKWWHLAAFIAAVVVSEVLIGVLKGIYDRARPPGSLVATTGASFPSGHAAQAFAAAEFMRMEYKDVSPWYGVAGYAAAVATGMLRVYNDKHWMSDVVAGAGVGIASTRLAYWLYPKIKHYLWKDKPNGAVLMPSYSNGSFGMNFAYQFK